MPVLTIKNEYVLALTYKCNWNCSYCAVRNGKDPRPDAENDIFQRAETIPDNSNVTLTGGEPGLLSRELLENVISFFESKNCSLWMETNGIFLKNFPDLVKRFTEILYHCTENVGENDVVLRCYGADNIRYLIIATDENCSRIGDFIRRNPGLKFDIIPVSYPYEITGPALSSGNRYDVLFRYREFMTDDSKKRMFKDKDFDSICYKM